MSTVRTRFAPSPTGFLHVGGIRTALFAWLVAKHNGGAFILRIEDTDKAREVQGSADHIQTCLKWLGLAWDEGPHFQSERLDIYKKYAQQLVGAGKAYADPYTPEQVQAFRDAAKAAKKPFLYRDYRPESPPTWDGTRPLRLKSNPTSQHYQDGILQGSDPDTQVFHNQVNFGPEAIDDFILMKSDGYPTYNFAHVVDDHEMGVTDVIRGQEFLASIPKYLDLYTSLGFEVPRMYTLPHVLNSDGNKKLSKRDGAKDILAYRDEGYLPEAMISFLATLGWNDGTEQEVFTLDELIKKFDIRRVQKAGAHFDERRLQWVNGYFIRQLPLDDLYKRVEDFWPEEAASADESYKKQVLGLVQERLKYCAELPELTRFFFTDLPVNPELISGHKQLKKLSLAEVRKLLEQARASLDQSDFSVADLTERLNELLETTGQKPAALFSLVRIAATQAPASPGLAASLAVLGKDRSLKRIDEQLAALS